MIFDSASKRIGRPEQYRPRRPGYGERKRAREAAKVPLLADTLPTAEEYERRLLEGNRLYVRGRRHLAAQMWAEVRRWLREATPEKRAAFDRRWLSRWHPPHDPYYAADLCYQIDQGAATIVDVSSADLMRWQSKHNSKRVKVVRGVIIALLWTTLLCRPASADVGDAKLHPLCRWDNVVMCEVTAYTNNEESTGKRPGHLAYGLTARGTRTRPGVCSADPRVPYGTKLWIEGYGVATVEDRGGAIRSNKLDVWMEDLNDALRFGRRKCRVVVLE